MKQFVRQNKSSALFTRHSVYSESDHSRDIVHREITAELPFPSIIAATLWLPLYCKEITAATHAHTLHLKAYLEGLRSESAHS